MKKNPIDSIHGQLQTNLSYVVDDDDDDDENKIYGQNKKVTITTTISHYHQIFVHQIKMSQNASSCHIFDASKNTQTN